MLLLMLVGYAFLSFSCCHPWVWINSIIQLLNIVFPVHLIVLPLVRSRNMLLHLRDNSTSQHRSHMLILCCCTLLLPMIQTNRRAVYTNFCQFFAMCFFLSRVYLQSWRPDDVPYSCALAQVGGDWLVSCRGHLDSLWDLHPASKVSSNHSPKYYVIIERRIETVLEVLLNVTMVIAYM